MSHENKAQLHIDELCYYVMIFIFMSIRAVGLQDGQWPFKVLLILGLVAFIPKFLLTKFNGLDQIISILLIALGFTIFFINGHLEFLVGVCMVVGMKNVPVRRAVNVALGIWGVLFVFSVIRALLGGFQGYVCPQEKAGFSLIRYSLGFSHQNVLHMTYLIIVLLILYATKRSGRRLIVQSILLFLGNIYIFVYSVSYTGFISVSLALLINIYFAFRRNINVVEKILVTGFLAVCFAVLTVGPFLLPEKLFGIVNTVTNSRFSLTKDVFSIYAPNLFGHSEDIHAANLNLDSSYAYLIFYSGIVAFTLFAVGFLLTTLRLMKKHDQQGVALMVGVGISGITEQYVGNLSFKNISLFFIGDYVFNHLTVKLASKSRVFDFERAVINLKKDSVSCEGLAKLWRRVREYFKGTPLIKCVLPGAVMALVGLILFNIFYVEPTKLYWVVQDESEGKCFTYHEAEKDRLDDGLLIGTPTEGALICEPSYVNLHVETYRGIISSIVWGFIAGFVISAFVLNTKKLNTVYIEEPIEADNDGKRPPMPVCRILGVNIAVTNMHNTLSYFDKYLDDLRGRYICVSNVHTTITAFRDPEYLKVQNGAAIALPDGKPLSHVSRRRGFLQADRVAGPDLMTEIFKISADKGYRHFFFGSTEETLNALRTALEERYPGINICGMLSPNYYRTVEDIPKEEDAEHIRIINEAKPDFIWVGLGAPKQEIWMAAHEGCFNGVMLGVGAGFDFHAGTVKRAPKIMQMLYLEWLYRLFQDPKRLFKRYFDTNFSFIRESSKEGCFLKKNPPKPEKPRLLIYAHYYAPDVASTGQILTELSEGMLDAFEITVIAVVPSYSGKVDEYYEKHRFYQQDMRGVRVLRVRVPEFTKKKKLSRVRNIVAYYFGARAVTKKVGPQEYVLSISQPPILGGMLGAYGKRKKKAKFIYNIQDFNPEQIESVSYSSNGMLLKIMKRMDKGSCRKSDLIITVGRDLGETIEKRFTGQSVPKYVIINNWIDETKVYPLASDDEGVQRFRKQWDLENKFVFMYSGNLGLYYDLEKLLEVIENITPSTKTPDGRSVHFAFVGNGTLRDDLVAYVKEHKMTNVSFIPYQSKEELNYSLNAGDVHICVNARGIKGVSCPSKYYGIAAVGKPVLASLEAGSEIRTIIEETSGGLVSDPEDYNAIFKNIRKFIEISGSNELRLMGESGHDNLMKNLRKDVSIEKYKDAILREV